MVLVAEAAPILSRTPCAGPEVFVHALQKRLTLGGGFHLLDLTSGLCKRSPQARSEFESRPKPQIPQTGGILAAIWSIWQQRSDAQPAPTPRLQPTLHLRVITLLEDASQIPAWLAQIPIDLQTVVKPQLWGLQPSEWHCLNVALPQWDEASRTSSSFCILMAIGAQTLWPQLLTQIEPQVDWVVIDRMESLLPPLTKAVVKSLRQINAQEPPCIIAQTIGTHNAAHLDTWLSLGLGLVAPTEATPTAKSALRSLHRMPPTLAAVTQLQPLPWLSAQLLQPRKKSSPRASSTRTSTPTRHVHIIGAGLAGSSCAWMLAQQGVCVTVWDKASHIAAGASAMPAGLFEVTPSKDHNPLTQITRHGVRFLQSVLKQLAPTLEHGVHWCDSGITTLAHRPRHVHAHLAQSADGENSATWPAGWIQPAALVAALLEHPLVQVQLAAAIPTEHPVDWLVQHGETVTDVIFATGFEAPSAAIHPVAGQVLWAPHDPQSHQANWPDRPVNGLAYIIPHVPQLGNSVHAPDRGSFWLTGASFDHHDLSALPSHTVHIQNWQRLQAMLPDTAKGLDFSALQDLSRHARKGIRGTTRDRLPLVGLLSTMTPKSDDWHSIDAWICAGLGSRGISIALWCAQLLATQLLRQPPLASIQWQDRLNPNR